MGKGVATSVIIIIALVFVAIVVFSSNLNSGGINLGEISAGPSISKCSDIDGSNYYVRGTCTDESASYVDSCSSSSLVEYSCGKAFKCASSTVACPSGYVCSNGACVTTTSPTVPTPTPGGFVILSADGTGVAVDSTGFYVVGSNVVSFNNYEWSIEKRNLATGTIIWTQSSNPSDGVDSAHGAAVDSTGLYVVGYDNTPGNYQWRIEKRDLATGTLLWNQSSNPSDGVDSALRVAVDSSGLYIVGSEYVAGRGKVPDNYQWRIEKRDLATGALLWSQTYNPTSNDDYSIGGYLDVAYDVAIDSSGLYVVGADLSSGIYDPQWRIEKRNLATGTIIWTQSSNPSGTWDIAYGAAVDSTGLYVVGMSYSAGGFQWRFEKRDLATGTLLWNQSSNPSSDSATPDRPSAVAVDSTGVYVVGWISPLCQFCSTVQWHIEKHNLNTGALLWARTSGEAGVLTYAYDVDVDSTGVYVVGTRIEKRDLATGE